MSVETEIEGDEEAKRWRAAIKRLARAERSYSDAMALPRREPRRRRIIERYRCAISSARAELAQIEERLLPADERTS